MDIAACLGDLYSDKRIAHSGSPFQPSEFMETLEQPVQTAVSIQIFCDNLSTSNGIPVELEE